MRRDTLSQRLLNLEDAAELLGVSQEEVQYLAQRGHIEAYRIGGTYLRFRQDQVEGLKKRLLQEGVELKERGDRGGSEAKERGGWKLPEAAAADDPSLADRLKDFWYFNNLYIISAAIIITLVILILR